MDHGTLSVFDAGLIGFNEAVRLQHDLVEKVRSRSLAGALVFASHPPVITLGRGARKENIKVSSRELSRRNIPVYACRRGGDVTYHGPGQLVLYPIIDLRRFARDLHWFLRSLEAWAIAVLSEAGIAADARPGATGVWVGAKKIASIGIGVRDWVTFNGMALNVACSDLENFALIRPCGTDCAMTCVEQEGARADTSALKQTFIRRCPYV